METKNSAIFELNLKGNVFPQKMKKLHEEKCRPIYSTWHRSFSWRTFGIIYCSFADFLVFNPPAAWKQNLIKTKMHCKINFTCESDCVSKNVTPRRMLKKCFRISQMNRQIQIYQICIFGAYFGAPNMVKWGVPERLWVICQEDIYPPQN